MKTRPTFCCSLAVCLVLTAVGRNDLRAAEPTFLTDVMAVLSKGGCNSGSCHGNQNGKGGLKLSLRGEDPLADYHTLLHGVQRFHGWIRQQIDEGRSMSEFARQLVASSGSTYETPATNFYRGHRDPASRGEAAAQILLGVRLQCAKCHNHPFDRWTQSDYYSWAAVFAGIDYKIVENKRQGDHDAHLPAGPAGVRPFGRAGRTA